MTGSFVQFEDGGPAYPLGECLVQDTPLGGRGLGALTGAAIVSQFDSQLESMARTLSGPQEWVLTFDEAGLEQLVREGTKVGKYHLDDRGCPVADCTLELETKDLWALATLTDQDGGEWTSGDGETWTCGDRRMVL